MIILRQKEYSLPIGRFLAGFNRKVLRMPKIKSYRTAIKSQDKVLGAGAKALNMAKKSYYTPGSVLNKGISKSIENPVTSIGTIVGKATDFTHPATAVIPKATIAAAIGNKVLPKSVKLRLKNAAEKYEKSKVAKMINEVPSVPEMAKFVGDVGRNTGVF